MVQTRTNPSLTRKDMQTLLWTKMNINFPVFVVVYEEIHGGTHHPAYMEEQFNMMQRCFLDFSVKWPLWSLGLVDAYLARRHLEPQDAFPPVAPFWDDYR